MNSQSNADLVIYNVLGQTVRNLGSYQDGNHDVVWNGMNDNNQTVSGGIYFARLTSGNKVKTQKLTLIK